MFRVTQDTTKLPLASITGLSPSMAVLSRTFFSQVSCYSVVLQPHNCVATTVVWARPLSLAATRGVTCLFSPPAATKMFQFTAFAHLSVSPLGGVPPFGHPRVNGCLRLAGEFRRLSRPSSPLGARASSVRPCLLLFSGRAASAAAPVSPVMMSMCVSQPSGPRGGECRIRTDDPLLAGQVL